ncbi:MAG: peroxiredoxin [Cyanophyceae cyanobacterium]
MSVEVGSLAPDFTLPSARPSQVSEQATGRVESGSITLSAYRGKTNVLLAFYPGDFTPVCTSEMQCFADDWEQFRVLGCEILGISSDPISKHEEFASQLKLPFPLLSDGDKTISKQYGVDSFLGTQRAYFIIDLQGILRYKHVEWLPVFKRNDEELLNVLRELKAA